uniref:Uncharacterized protein n=1 Tax=Brassica oleracea var. oleracea TaxID=109376 RepID=A0A0D3CBF9_BRAOL
MSCLLPPKYTTITPKKIKPLGQYNRHNDLAARLGFSQFSAQTKKALLMDFTEMTGVKPKTHKRIKDACRFLVSAVLGTILSAILTFFFALMGTLLGAVTGALIGHKTESGFI